MPSDRLSSRSAWLMTLGLVAIYTTYYARQLWLSDAVPTFDQAAYVAKTWAIADVLWHPIDHIGRLFNPATYLGEPAANRPPLMMVIAAMFTGPSAKPRTIATVWLVVRLAVLLLALRRLQALIGDVARGWWIPASAAVMLAAPTNHVLYPNLYMMDTPFEAFGLLAIVCLATDLYRQSTRTALHAVLATLALFLIKPAALLFVGPLYVWIGWQSRRRDWRRIWPYAAMVVTMGLLLLSPYGRAVIDQYRLGMTGYWATHKSLPLLLRSAALVVPYWLMILGGYAMHRRAITRAAPLTYLVSAILIGVWWFVFNALLTYTLDARILPAAMPVVVTAALVAACALYPRTAVGLSVFVFGVSMVSALGAMPAALERGMATLTPLPGPQSPVREVGLKDLVVGLSEAAPPGSRVMMICHDDFVEVNAVQLGVRMFTTTDLVLDTFPWGTGGLDLRDRFTDPRSRYEFFVTKSQRKAAALEGDVWTNLQALDALLLASDSPWQGRFKQVFASPIVQPDRADLVNVWRLVTPLTEADLAAGYAYILPRYVGTPGEREIRMRADAVKP